MLFIRALLLALLVTKGAALLVPLPRTLHFDAARAPTAPRIIRGGTTVLNSSPIALLSDTKQSFAKGWAERAAAAGSSRTLLTKAFLEITLAVTFQLLAEIQRRRGLFWFEFDYVLAGLLTAVMGKGYTAWATAPTLIVNNDKTIAAKGLLKPIPTNFFAFGAYSHSARCLAVVQPMPRLFGVGAMSAFVGYGLAAVLSAARVAMGIGGTQGPPKVPILGAAIFTGIFLVSVSNLSFQIVQGFVEPRVIDPLVHAVGKGAPPGGLRDRFASSLRWALVALTRSIRGIIVSGLAIRGMQYTGLQKQA